MDPGAAQAFNNRGGSYFNLGKVRRAIKDFDQAIRLAPDYASAYANRGVAFSELGQTSKSESDNAKACSLNSELC